MTQQSYMYYHVFRKEYRWQKPSDFDAFEEEEEEDVSTKIEDEFMQFSMQKRDAAPRATHIRRKDCNRMAILCLYLRSSSARIRSIESGKVLSPNHSLPGPTKREKNSSESFEAGLYTFQDVSKFLRSESQKKEIFERERESRDYELESS